MHNAVVRPCVRLLSVLSLALVAAPLGCDGCGPRHKVPDFVDAAVQPPPLATTSAELPVLEVDAGVEAGVDAGARGTGLGLDPNQIRAKRCCKALRDAVASLPTSTEKVQMQGVAATCDTIASGLGRSSGGSPTELEPLRQLLKGRVVPDVCRGL